ncbi:MAG: EF-P lysine aminoacylase EpmA [Planctomycetota bacterium]
MPEALPLWNDLLQATRRFFAERGFAEVHTPLALPEVIPERHIEPVQTADGLFLQASPELAMKRLLCGRSGPIFQIGKAFRDDEHGRLHRREFTMLEWYRPGDDLRAGMQLLDEFVQATLGTPPCVRASYRDAFWRACRVDPLNATSKVLAGVANDLEVAIEDAADLRRDDWLNLLLSSAVEPRLGRDAPEIVYHYPASQAALASTATDAIGIEVAERFELCCRGVELANGYHELTDAAELRRRLVEVNEQREADGRRALPLPESLLADMETKGLRPCAGVALGFDRLVMLAAGAQSLAEIDPLADMVAVDDGSARE